MKKKIAKKMRAAGSNMLHLPSSLLGVLTVLSVLPQSETVRQIAAINPKIANAITLIGCLATAIGMIFGIGPKAPADSREKK
jgi:hypothetical protein